MTKSNLVHSSQETDLRELSAVELEDVAGGGFWFGFGIGMIVGEAIYNYMKD
jgi:hypothetical protein